MERSVEEDCPTLQNIRPHLLDDRSGCECDFGGLLLISNSDSVSQAL